MVKNNTHDHSKMEQKLYAKIDEIETSRMIRSQFDVPVIYVWIMILIAWYHNFLPASKLKIFIRNRHIHRLVIRHWGITKKSKYW